MTKGEGAQAARWRGDTRRGVSQIPAHMGTGLLLALVPTHRHDHRTPVWGEVAVWRCRPTWGGLGYGLAGPVSTYKVPAWGTKQHRGTSSGTGSAHPCGHAASQDSSQRVRPGTPGHWESTRYLTAWEPVYQLQLHRRVAHVYLCPGRYKDRPSPSRTHSKRHPCRLS